MKTNPIEITSIAEIIELAKSGFENWTQYGYVNVTERGDLLLFDYTTRAHIANRWNFFERVCRGLIINKKTGEIVARPFDKFFYWLAAGRKVSGHIVSITEKIDGSLAILFRHKGEYHITTKGSFFSPQARWATKFLNDHFDLSNLPEQWTLLFEIIYPDNRIIVDYGKQEDLILLAARNRHTGEYMPFFPDLYQMAQEYGFTLPKVYQYNSIEDLIIQTGGNYDNFEGWVVEFSDGQRVKFKTDRYVEVHRYIRQLDFPNVLQAVRNGDIDYLTTLIPDDFLEQVYEWIIEIQEMVQHINAKTVQAFVQAPRTNGDVFRQWVNEHQPELAPYLLAMWEGKDIEPLIYKLAFTDKLQSS
jgi:RNA ligase